MSENTEANEAGTQRSGVASTPLLELIDRWRTEAGMERDYCRKCERLGYDKKADRLYQRIADLELCAEQLEEVISANDQGDSQSPAKKL